MRPLNTEAKSTMQQHSWPAFDSWLAAWAARGHPLSEYCHANWYDAPLGTVKRIDRTGWPDGVTTEALLRDYKQHIRERSDRNAPVLNERQIASELRSRDLWREDRPRQYRVEKFDDKKNQTITMRVRVYPAPHQRQVAEYLEDKYGFRVHIDDDVAVEEVGDEPAEF